MRCIRASINIGDSRAVCQQATARAQTTLRYGLDRAVAYGRQMRWLFLLLALTDCTVEGPVPGARCLAVPVARVPLDVISDVPVVTAEVNGLPVRMLLDTGAAQTVVSPQLARRLGLRPAGRAIAMEGAGGSVLATPVVLEQVRLGSSQGMRLPAIIERTLDLAPDGVIGVDYLSAFDIDLDMPGRVMALYAPSQCGAPPWSGHTTELPVLRNTDRQVAVPITVNGVGLLAALDTGNSVTFLTPRAAARAGIGALLVEAAPSGAVEAFNGMMAPVRRVQVDRLGVGTSTLRFPVLQVGALPDRVGDGLLGGDYLATHRVWLALATGRVSVADDP